MSKNMRERSEQLSGQSCPGSYPANPLVEAVNPSSESWSILEGIQIGL